MKKIVLSMLVVTLVYSDNCFNATGKAFADAQTIRKTADSMGWKVSKTSSITAGTFIKGKAKLYPQDKIEICLQQSDDKLEFRAQSTSSDAGKAVWRKLLGKKR